MFICNKDKQQAYISYMEKLKARNRACREKRQELILRNWNEHIRDKNFLSSLRNRLSTLHSSHAFNTSSEKQFYNAFSERTQRLQLLQRTPHSYIHLYFRGLYRLIKPQLEPDNIDYYAITDQSIPSEFPVVFFECFPY